MHVHILGVCGTFMGGIAAIAKQSGYRVTGCDANVYPPMSTQLEALGIELIPGYDPEQVKLRPDVFVIGNVISRGNTLMEEILDRALPYASGPEWLASNVLQDKWVLAVAGTHGKTTTSAMLAWILEHAGLNPGFLIGGIPENFGISARLGIPFVPGNSAGTADQETDFFVIEADEYDTAFFDKRSKFVHYRPRTAILNNLEFDHADIFPDLAAIETQFHHLVRTVPRNGLLVVNGSDPNLARVLERGHWTPVEYIASDADWQCRESSSGLEILWRGQLQGTLRWPLIGRHNQHNALAALAAARHAGVPVGVGIEALSKFENVKRRMEVRGVVNGITVYDDFAHHPTAIQTTLEALRNKVGTARILAALEPRSNTMKLGVWKDSLAGSLACADHVFCYTGGLGWDAAAAMQQLGSMLFASEDLEALVAEILRIARPGDHILIMSNGGFGGIHEKLLQRLRT